MESLPAQLAQLEDVQLVRRLPDEELAYFFKHALTQEAAYDSLLYKTRREIHHAVAGSYERLYPERLDEYAALLAHHFELAEEPHKALNYLVRAAEWARRAVAHREEAALLARAITLAEQLGRTELMADLYARRGRAFTSVALWNDASEDLLRALALLSPDDIERRAEVLIDLASATQWLWNMRDSIQYAQDALALAETAHRNDLVAGALSALALARASDGQTRQSLTEYDRAFARAGDLPAAPILQGLELSGLVLYWLGEYDAAVNRIRTAIHRAREANDTVTVMRGFSTLGLALMGRGDYGEALGMFEEARQFGETHGIGALLARSRAMLGGVYLNLFDFQQAERVAEEARSLGRLYGFPPAVVSAGIDLLLNYARTGHLYRAERLVREVEEVLPKTYGSHRWLWGLRFAEARAELAAARTQWHEALEAADDAIAQSRATQRVKYEALALQTRATALIGLGRTREAIADLRAAVELAELVGDPVMFLRSAAALLRVEGSDALAAQTRAAARRVSASLSPGALRDRFEAYTSELA